MIDPVPTPKTPSTSNTDLAETVIPGSGSTIVGDYELLGEVARGGMGVVYKARQRSLDRLVALKLILSGDEASVDELKRFQVEAQAAARLDHPGIVPVYGFGELDGHPFLSMGFVDGPSLSRRLAERGPLAPREAAELLRQVADAVAAAHRKQVIHRDLKPGNVLIDEEGRARVTDFGLAKRQDAGQSLTATGQVLGTPAYMSPEQAAGQEVGPLSDVYSVGATLYAALTGKPPFASGSIPEVLLQVADVRPVPPSQHNRAVPTELDAICLKCLEKRPEDRYGSARELAEVLRRFLEASLVTDLVRRTPNKRGYWLAAIGVLLAVAVSVGLWLGRQGVVPREPVVDANDKRPSHNTTPPDTSPKSDDEKLRAALLTAQDDLLPNEATVWEYRFASAGDSYERAFQDAGIEVDDNDPTEAMELLQRRSKEYRELVLQGLEQWELCADAAKQAPRAASLRQLEDALDTLAWRKTVRLSRADADVKILLQAVREALANSPTSEQIDNLVLLIASLPLQRNPEAVGLLRSLLQTSPQSYLPNLVLASALQAIGQTKPTEAAAYASESIVPLQIAAKARPSAFLPHWQLIALHTQLNNPDAIAKEQDQLNQLRHPRAWPLLQSARAARVARQFDKAAEDARAAMRVDPDLPTGRSELIAALILSNHESEATELLRQIGDESADDATAFRAYDELSRLIEASRLDDKSRRTFTGNRESSARAFRDFFLHRRKLTPENLPPAAIAPFDAEQARDHQEAWSKYLGIPIEYTNSIGMKFRLIPPGEFLMGSTEEEIDRVLSSKEAIENINPPEHREYWKTLVRSEAPRHRVVFAQAVYFGMHEVTQGQYETVMGSNPSYFCKTGKNPDCVALVAGLDTTTHPVENVLWTDAVKFTRQLSETEWSQTNNEKSSRSQDSVYRLPTEAEWEFACRAGTTTPFWYGDFGADVVPHEWFGNSAGRPHAVGELARNPFGLFDMLGNVSEWAQDGLSESAYQQAVFFAFNPVMASDATPAHVYRGGYYHRIADNGRSATRWATDSAGALSGFRAVLSIDIVHQQANAESLAKQLRFEQAESLLRAGVKARKAKDFATAEKKAREAMTLQPDVPNGDFELAVTLLASGKEAESEVVLARIADNVTNNSQALESIRKVFQAVVSLTEATEPEATRQAVQRAWAVYGKHRLKLKGEPPPLAVAPFDAEQARQHQSAWSKYLGIPIEYTNSSGMKFRLIPPGEFLMGATPEEVEFVITAENGYRSFLDRKFWDQATFDYAVSVLRSESPLTRVVLTNPLYVGAHEVTQEQYEKLVGKNPSGFSKNSTIPGMAELFSELDPARHPVDNVSWNDTTVFCQKLSELEQRKPFYRWDETVFRSQVGDGYRLPTEAEWEFFCRAGTTTLFWSGDSTRDFQLSEWSGNSGGFPHEVGELSANPFGLFDVHGNLQERTQDVFDFQMIAKRSPTAPAFDPRKDFARIRSNAIRGGYMTTSMPLFCRAAHRTTNHLPDPVTGFRVVLSIDGVRASGDAGSLAARMRFEEAESLFRAAQRSRTAKEFAAAIEHSRQALALVPDLPMGNIELAANLLLDQQSTEADALIKTLVSSASDNATAFRTLRDIFEIVERNSADGNDPTVNRRIVERAWAVHGPLRLKLSGDVPPFAIAPFNAEAARQHQEAWAKYLQVPVEYTNSLGMKFRLIPPGEFLMGATREELDAYQPFLQDNQHVRFLFEGEPLQHTVLLSQPFYLCQHEVTQKQYEQVLGRNPSQFAPSGMGQAQVQGLDTNQFPVEMVGRTDALRFCDKLGTQEQLQPTRTPVASAGLKPQKDDVYSLPSEAQWEFACRAGTTTRFWNGDAEADLNRVGWTPSNALGRTHPVGELAANPFGLFDTHGNVWEWTRDYWAINVRGTMPPTPTIDLEHPVGGTAVMVGGSCIEPGLAHARSASRTFGWINYRGTDPTGFRPSLSVDAVRQEKLKPSTERNP